MSSQYGELRPTSTWDRFVSLRHPSKFQQLSRLGFVTAATSLNGSQPNFAQCLAISWAGTLYIHLRHPKECVPKHKLLVMDMRFNTTTRHRASTSMYSLTFRVRVITPRSMDKMERRMQQARRFYRRRGESIFAGMRSAWHCLQRAVCLAD